MDGAHDMGGVPWSGPVRPEPNEPPFHADWERRAFAVTLAMAMPGGWNIDMSRFARENRPPADYLSKSYYEIWLAGLERLLEERKLISEDEIAAGERIRLAERAHGDVRRGPLTNPGHSAQGRDHFILIDEGTERNRLLGHFSSERANRAGAGGNHSGPFDRRIRQLHGCRKQSVQCSALDRRRAIHRGEPTGNGRRRWHRNLLPEDRPDRSV